MKKQRNSRLMALLCLIILGSSCTYEQLPSPNDCSNLAAPQLVSVTEADCGVNNGALEVAMEDETATYTFSIDGENFQNDGKFEGIGAGTYTVTVANEIECTNTLVVAVPNKNGFNVTAETSNSGCGTSLGDISLAVEGGEAPFEFKIEGQAFQTENVFEGLENGIYEVTAKDGTGCVVTAQVRVVTGIEFSTVNSIIQTNCAVSGCHAGTGLPDFRNASVIQQNASNIRGRTGSRSMPPRSSGRTLTDDQIEKIACWVSDGAQIQ